jgi:hypothetical protein
MFKEALTTPTNRMFLILLLKMSLKDVKIKKSSIIFNLNKAMIMQDYLVILYLEWSYVKDIHRNTMLDKNQDITIKLDRFKSHMEFSIIQMVKKTKITIRTRIFNKMMIQL